MGRTGEAVTEDQGAAGSSSCSAPGRPETVQLICAAAAAHRRLKLRRPQAAYPLRRRRVTSTRMPQCRSSSLGRLGRV